ncbi:DapH/DapD/GlmU-related protein [Brachybacterium sp. FME24]|uniref:acyltransferase n=1 Tax=Brachybacterium sp. FME24 TaxID=2742605 RepID=UPI0018663673|nr:acyltransferase [Brachybacterium sp. FME24]
MKRKYYSSVLARCGARLTVCHGATLRYPERIHVGDDVYINRRAIVTARETVKIGDNVLIGPNVVIDSGDHIFADTDRPIWRQGFRNSPVEIGQNVWLGANVTVLKGVSIGRGSVIGAGAVVTRDIPEYSVAHGVPAVVVRSRATMEMEK